MLARLDVRCFEFLMHPGEDVLRVRVIFHCLWWRPKQPGRECVNSLSSSGPQILTKHHPLHSARRPDWPIQFCPEMDFQSKRQIELCVIAVSFVWLNLSAPLSNHSLDPTGSCWTERPHRSRLSNRNSPSWNRTCRDHRGECSFFDFLAHWRHLNPRFLNWSDQESVRH